MSSQPLRQRGKARRWVDIVAAASALWRDHGIDNVSLNQIAAKAEVAPQTIYNLVGGLDAIGFAVIKVALERLDAGLAATSATGLALALESARKSVELYTADAGLYRQLLVRVPKALFDGTHLGRDTAEIVVRAMLQARGMGEIMHDVDPDRLGRVMYVNYLGALYDWACGDSGDAAFLRAAEIAILAPAAACASETMRPDVTAQLLTALSLGGSVAAVGDE